MLGLVHFLICTAANYTHVSLGKKAEELKTVWFFYSAARQILLWYKLVMVIGVKKNEFFLLVFLFFGFGEVYSIRNVC